MLKIVINTVIVYFMLVLTVRLMGKRQIGELQLSEMITTILLSEIVSAPITNPDYPVMYSAVASAIILAFEVVVPMLMERFTFLKTVIEGKPSYLIYKGKLLQKELKRNRITINELLASLHSSNISDISELEYLILEPNGQLSPFPKIDYKNATVGDLKKQTKDEGIAHALIIDGKICNKSLRRLKISDQFLNTVLERNNATVKGTLLLTINDIGEINLIRKT